MNVNINNYFVRKMLNIIQHYNHENYWKMRKEVINSNSKLPLVIRYYYLLRIKKMDAYNNASMGTDMGQGAYFETPPILFHGLNGIVISHYAIVGKNCTILQQVTISQGEGKTSANIGDNCFIGAGAKIIGNVHIGDNVKIGANTVVVKDIPDNCTVVGVPARIIDNTTANLKLVNE
jgi:serine O-acetyltransferase